MRVADSLSLWLGILLLLLAGAGVGCSKKDTGSKPGEIVVTAKIAGAPDAKKALETKDYDAVLKSLGTASAAIDSEAAQAEYRKLTYEVLDGLRLYRDTDPKAEETFQAVRGMLMGR
jgi:hypothetical protein